VRVSTKINFVCHLLFCFYFYKVYLCSRFVSYGDVQNPAAGF
jgi:hypothetical protein